MEELTLKEIHHGTLKIMDRIDEICNQLEINYFLMFGSLIGAIRHNGFIPWDDDLDIMMIRDDYEKLLKYFRDNKMNLYPLKLFSSEMENYPYMISRISDIDYKLIVENEESFGIGLFVDVYPIDGVGNSMREVKCIAKKVKYLASLCYLSTRQKCIKDNTKSIIRLILKYPSFLFSKVRGKKYFKNRINEYIGKHKYEECQYVGCTSWLVDMEKEVFPKEWVESTTYASFEAHKFKIPEHYHEILTQIYGDYMKLPPENERIAHHYYKAYKKEQS